MEITSIKQKSGNKYELVIDNKKYIILGDVLLNLNILSKKSISSDEYKELINNNNYYELYYKMIHYVSTKMRTEKEIYLKLRELKTSKEMSDKIVEKLKQKGYIDKEKYLNSFINDQINLTLNGPIKIKNNLMKLGFISDEIENKLNDIPYDIWLEKANKIATKKQKLIKNVSERHFILKLRQDYYNLGYEEKYFRNILENIEYDEISAFKKEYQKYYKKYSSKYDSESIDSRVRQKLYSIGYKNHDIKKD